MPTECEYVFYFSLTSKKDLSSIFLYVCYFISPPICYRYWRFFLRFRYLYIMRPRWSDKNITSEGYLLLLSLKALKNDIISWYEYNDLPKTFSWMILSSVQFVIRKFIPVNFSEFPMNVFGDIKQNFCNLKSFV